MSEQDVAPPPSRFKWLQVKRCKCLPAKRCKCLEVKRCCFCISLLHGAYIIGTLQCFYGIVTLIITINLAHDAAVLTVGLIFEFIMSSILTATAALLLLGAFWKRPTLVLIWIVAIMAFVVFTVTNLTTLFIVQGFSMRANSIIVAVLGIYFSICMYSFYRKLVNHELGDDDDDFDDDNDRPETV